MKPLTYPASIQKGKLTLPSEQLKKDIKNVGECLFCEVVIREPYKGKTAAQLGAFHGPIITQVQDHYMDTDGVYMGRDTIKAELKEMFLPKVKQYYTDGSPMMKTVNHPEKKGVTYQWHYEKTPSLADLSLDDFRAFIDAILDWFQHERGLTIILRHNSGFPDFNRLGSIYRKAGLCESKLIKNDTKRNRRDAPKSIPRKKKTT